MQSPTVLKAIYSLEHGQSTERLAQTLLRLGVAPVEVEELTRNTLGGVGANWMTMAERVASERTARGQAVVAPELLRAANAMMAKRDTVRIHIQQRVNVVRPPSQQSQAPPPRLDAPASTPPRPAFPPVDPVPAAAAPWAPGGRSAVLPLAAHPPVNAGTPARRITAVIVPATPAPPRLGGAATPWTAGAGAGPGAGSAVTTVPKSALLAELEEAVCRLAANPSLESNGLSPAQSQALRDCLRPLLRGMTPVLAAVPGGERVPSEQKPISLRAQVKL